MDFIDLKAQYLSIEEKIDARIKAVLNHGQYILGPEVNELEEKLSEYVGRKYCVTCGNGTDALQIALMAKGIGPGDAVFTTSFTFFATAEVISLVGATPIFVDISSETYNICPEKLEEAVCKVKNKGVLTPKAIIAVDLFGLPAAYEEIDIISKKNGLFLIEDAAQGFGGSLDGRRACSFGDVSTTSFFPAKPLGCYGDGGALFTDDAELAEIYRSIRVHGKGKDKYDNIRIGLNSRLDTIQAAILLEKLEVFPAELVRRNEIAHKYSNELESEFHIPLVPEGYYSSWAQFTIRPKFGNSRDYYQSALKKENIPTNIYYGKSLHLQKAFSKISVENDLSISEAVESEVFSLPMHPYLENHEIDQVLEVISRSK